MKPLINRKPPLKTDTIQNRHNWAGTWWFDLQLVRAAHAFQYDLAFWRFVQETPSDALLNLDVRAEAEKITESHMEALCQAFAGIVDAKSPFIAEHALQVSAYAVKIAEGLGIGGRRLTTLRRAALPMKECSLS